MPQYIVIGVDQEGNIWSSKVEAKDRETAEDLEGRNDDPTYILTMRQAEALGMTLIRQTERTAKEKAR